jgi:hypothetical protein
MPIASDRVRQIRRPAVIKAEKIWLTAVRVKESSTRFPTKGVVTPHW